MELGIILIGIATFMNSVALAWLLSSNKSRTGPEPTQHLPLPLIDEIRAWQDAADERQGQDIPTPVPSIPAAAPPVDDSSPWKNQTGIQQGNVSSAPAPPVVAQPRPPLARPDGFVR